MCRIQGEKGYDYTHACHFLLYLKRVFVVEWWAKHYINYQVENDKDFLFFYASTCESVSLCVIFLLELDNFPSISIRMYISVFKIVLCYLSSDDLFALTSSPPHCWSFYSFDYYLNVLILVFV